MQQQRKLYESLFNQNHPSRCMRYLQKADIFAFLPVPKDDTVSTKQSLIGSIIFLVIFIAYITYDFVNFVVWNPPNQQTYRSPLDDKEYNLPDFALAFMTSTAQKPDIISYTQDYTNFVTYNWSILTKSAGSQTSQNVDFSKVTFLNNKSSNFDKISWMNNQTKQFYYILRTPIFKNISAHGLLYTSNQTRYLQVKASFCKNTTSQTCLPPNNMTQLSNYGRFFLFIQDQIDNSSISQETSFPSNNNFLLYNFFVIEGFYKRITINFQVIKTDILPDYFFRFRTETNLRLQVDSIIEEISKVNSLNPLNTDAIAFNMQLSPFITNNRISFSTIIDHISLWGAFFGVLFSVFALVFLSYNRNKFYKKHPSWNRFKQTLQNKIVIEPKIQ